MKKFIRSKRWKRCANNTSAAAIFQKSRDFKDSNITKHLSEAVWRIYVFVFVFSDKVKVRGIPLILFHAYVPFIIRLDETGWTTYQLKNCKQSNSAQLKVFNAMTYFHFCCDWK